MKTTIIFTPSHTGHNLEYLNILYNICLTKPLQRFVFVSPEQIREKLPLVEWEKKEHILFDFLTQEETNRFATTSLLKRHYWITKSVLSRVRSYHADKVFSLFIYPLALFGWFMFPRYVKVSGILYNIYLYDLPVLSKRKKKLNSLVYNAFARSKKFGEIFVLNDEKGACRLRERYRTGKFIKLPDPFTPPSTYEGDIRTTYGIEEHDSLLVHFGGLAKRKGTLNILKSLSLLSDEECSRFVFFFAGKVDESIKKEFYYLSHSQKERVRIIVKDEFCSYGFLASLCQACDAILMPYLETSQSSGLLGYASYFHKPVIASDKGLIGDLVSSYKLGVCGDVERLESLVSMYRQVDGKLIESPNDMYVTENSVEKFVATVSNVIE